MERSNRKIPFLAALVIGLNCAVQFELRANELCQYVLAGLGRGSDQNRAERVLDLMVKYAQSQSYSEGPGYQRLMVKAKGKPLQSIVRVSDERVRRSSIWVPDAPEERYELWSRLSAAEKLQVAKGLEAIYANGSFGIGIIHRYLNDGTYGQKLVDNMEKLERRSVDTNHPDFQLPEDALNEAKGLSAFSGVLWLKAATEQNPIGMCQHVACALAQNLHSLGAHPDHVALHFGKGSDQYALTHFYTGLHLPGLGHGSHHIFDGTPNFKPSEHLRDKRDKETAADRSWDIWTRRFAAQSGWEPNFLAAPEKSQFGIPTPKAPESTTDDLINAVIRVISDGDFKQLDRFIAAAPSPAEPNQWAGEITDMERVLQFTKDRWQNREDEILYAPPDRAEKVAKLAHIGMRPLDVRSPVEMTAGEFIRKLDSAIQALKAKSGS